MDLLILKILALEPLNGWSISRRLKLVSGERLRVGNDIYRPVGMKGWYHAVFRRDSDGEERLLSIDQLLRKMNDWI